MLRTIKTAIILIAYLIGITPGLFKADKLYKSGRYEELKVYIKSKADRLSKLVMDAAGTKIHIRGKENIPKDEAVMYVSNHQSIFDIPVLLRSLGVQFAFVSKAEMLKIPLVKRWMRYMNCVFIDRGNMRQSFQAINKTAQNINNGYSMLIFPEGTRYTSGKVETFKPGSLRIAQKAMCKIIPITLDGLYNIFENNGWFRIRRTEVFVTISEAIDTAKLSKDDFSKLSERVHDIVSSKLRIQTEGRHG